MKTLGKRLERLERSFAVRIGDSDDWGGLAKVRDEMLRRAERLGEPRCSEFRTKLDALGPTGLWCQGVRGLLAEHGIVQAGDESLAETVARALDIGTDELRACIAQGRIGSALLQRFEECGIATDNTC